MPQFKSGSKDIFSLESTLLNKSNKVPLSPGEHSMLHYLFPLCGMDSIRAIIFHSFYGAIWFFYRKWFTKHRKTSLKFSNNWEQLLVPSTISLDGSFPILFWIALAWVSNICHSKDLWLFTKTSILMSTYSSSSCLDFSSLLDLDKKPANKPVIRHKHQIRIKKNEFFVNFHYIFICS